MLKCSHSPRKVHFAPLDWNPRPSIVNKPMVFDRECWNSDKVFLLLRTLKLWLNEFFTLIFFNFLIFLGQMKYIHCKS